MRKFLFWFLLFGVFHRGISQSPLPYDWKPNAKWRGVEIQTTYVKMSDGVDLAVDIYLPRNRKKTETFPAIVHQTRYWRSVDLRWPFSWFSNGLIGKTGDLIQAVVENGYAIVNVDVRGSGASFGNRQYPWSEKEVKDGFEILDWICKQNWSNQITGTMGISYSGTAAEFLASTGHPSMKAALMMYSLYDVYDDISFPGGVHHEYFTANWGEANRMLDQGNLPTNKKRLNFLVKGVRRVDGKGKEKRLKAAIASHDVNIGVDQTIKEIQFRDDKNVALGIGPDDFSPWKTADSFRKNKVALYCWSGWFDGAYQHAAIKRYLNLREDCDIRLLIGPWEHGGDFHISPAAPAVNTFDHTGEILKFFDEYLKGKETGIKVEAPVHYFTMGEEKWKADSVWPPKMREAELFFQNDGRMNFMFDLESGMHTIENVDSFGTGPHSRWRSLLGQLKRADAYPDWDERSRLLNQWESPPLKRDFIVSGHPILELILKSNVGDAALHVYLQDVDENGKRTYITEGLLALQHWPLSKKEPIHKDVVPYRTFDSMSAKPLVADSNYVVKFDLLPTSWVFKKGHKIAVGMSLQDKDHFEKLSPQETIIKLMTGENYPSKMIFPVD